MGKMKSIDQAQTEFQALCRQCDELSLRFRDAVSQGERDAINDEWRQAVADRDAAEFAKEEPPLPASFIDFMENASDTELREAMEAYDDKRMIEAVRVELAQRREALAADDVPFVGEQAGWGAK